MRSDRHQGGGGRALSEKKGIDVGEGLCGRSGVKGWWSGGEPSQGALESEGRGTGKWLLQSGRGLDLSR